MQGAAASGTPEPHPSQAPAAGGGVKDVIPSIAERYVVREETARRIFECLRSTGGRSCQFDIPEFGGAGQWMPGMVMIRDHADRDLKAKVDGLCSELSAIVQGSNTSAPGTLDCAGKPPAAVGTTDMGVGESWWPASFGRPSASGEQCGVRYAHFPALRRLLVQRGAHIDAYDTGEHVISGVAQAQGPGSSVTFSSNRGPVGLEQLKCVPLA